MRAGGGRAVRAHELSVEGEEGEPPVERIEARQQRVVEDVAHPLHQRGRRRPRAAPGRPRAALRRRLHLHLRLRLRLRRALVRG